MYNLNSLWLRGERLCRLNSMDESKDRVVAMVLLCITKAINYI